MTSVPQHPADEAPTVVMPVVGARMVPLGSGRTGTPAPAAPGPTDPAPPRPGASRKRTLLKVGVAAAALALVAAGGTAAYATAGDIPRGTRVAGVDIGGKSRADARNTVGQQLGPRAFAPIRVTLDGKQFELPRSDSRLVLEVAPTVEQAAEGGPRLFGSREIAPVLTVDADKLAAALRKRLGGSRTATEPAISYAGVTPKVTYPQAGRDIDPARAVEAIKAGWPHDAVVDIPVVRRPPAMTREQVDALVGTLAAPAVARPVTVTAGAKSFTLTPAMIAKSLVFRADDAGKLTASVDDKKLRTAAASALATVESEPVDATIKLSGGKPAVVPGRAGTTVDVRKLGADLLKVLPEADNRRMTATLAAKAPETTDSDVAKFGVKERVSTFTTKFPGGLSSPRSHNIVTIAKEVDGALVKPGETFSLNGHTGIRSYAQGYKDAPVIVGGRLEPGVAGGASQFTTTLFNAAYYAGLQDVEHKPHSFYFSRYPSVIESTIFYPELDLKFKNTTPYGILIDTSHTSSTVTVSMWSTKHYDSVTTERSPRRNITSPPTRYREAGPKCIATGGLPGFTQDAYRIIRKNGEVIKREKFTWRYDPEPRFICGPKPS